MFFIEVPSRSRRRGCSLRTDDMMECAKNFTLSVDKFYHCYWNIHGYVSLTICIWGLITNVINISVLTKKSMRSPINCILTGIAISDMITMSSYIPFAVHFYLLNDKDFTPSRNTYGWMVFLAVHMNITVTSHTASIWMGVIMAIMRFHRETDGPGRQESGLPLRPLGCGVHLPGLRGPRDPQLPHHEGRAVPNETLWTIQMPEVGTNNTDSIAVLTYLVYPICGKIIPVMLISIFGGLLLQTLRETDRRGRRLKGDTNCGPAHNQNRRTTIMLLCIIFMYVISEVPQSVILIMCVAVQGFFRNVYLPVSDLIDTIALLNSAVNFIMYCTMSRQFRNCLKDSLRACVKGCTGNGFKQVPCDTVPTSV
ncbi:LOW QUALITY PROTEIN: probable G-protein coupled receptor 139 [Pomacea canaliculata]|uniref:LOW QUALITY PROTEIN: probable G-protein coupled receptor 139 n=1 Tax=Pomacea canaliculata TaxID=400727 RepID=UPI000D7345A9|nr:LOW QUALITY PROTEIN: probable G-protein coupled receptor 139 [Pomacea canaliculata]